MLKIKDGVDLNKLEKYGFEWQPFTYLDEYIDEYRIDIAEDRRGSCVVLFVRNSSNNDYYDRVLQLEFCGDDNGNCGEDLLNDIIYDLIKDDLVEKV